MLVQVKGNAMLEVQFTLLAIGSCDNCELILLVHLHGENLLGLGSLITRADDKLANEILKHRQRALYR